SGGGGDNGRQPGGGDQQRVDRLAGVGRARQQGHERDHLRAGGVPDLHRLPVRVEVRGGGQRDHVLRRAGGGGLLGAVRPRVRPDGTGGPLGGDGLFDQRHGGGVRPRARKFPQHAGGSAGGVQRFDQPDAVAHDHHVGGVPAVGVGAV